MSAFPGLVGAVAPDGSGEGRLGTLGPPKTLCRKMGEKCPIYRALKLRKDYLKACAGAEKKKRGLGERLEAALFTKQVAEGWKKKEPEIWGHARGPGGSGEASSFANSYLKEDIERIEEELKKSKELVESACEPLVNLLRDEKFRIHCHDEHVSWVLDADTVRAYYPEDFEKGYNPETPRPNVDLYKTDKPFWREIDHYLAVLTEHLTASEKGRVFLDELLDDGKLGSESKVGFGTLWGYIRRVDSLTGPLGKFFYNASGNVVEKIQRGILEGSFKSIDEVFQSSPIQKGVKFLSEKMGHELSAILKEHSKKAAKLLDKVTKDVEAKGYFSKPKLAKELNAIGEKSPADKLNNAWLSITIATAALGLSVFQLAGNYKKRGAKDKLGFTRDIITVARDLARLSDAGLKAAENTFLARGQIETASKWGGAAKIAGAAAAVCATLVFFASAEEAWKQGQGDMVLLNILGGVGSAIGGIASLAGMATLAGFAGVAVLIITLLILWLADPPIIVWLELTPWGTEHDAGDHIPVPQVIDEFFRRLFTLEVAISGDHGHIEVASNALTDSDPARVSLVQESPRMDLGEKKVYPGKTSVAGKGEVKKHVDWDLQTRPKRILIRRVREIWPSVRYDGTTTYTVRGRLDPDHDGKYELTAEATGKTFPKPNIYRANAANWWKKHWAKSGVGIARPATDRVTLNITTEFADGCWLQVVLVEEDRPTTCISERVPVNGDRIIDTEVTMDLPPPPPRTFSEVHTVYELEVRVTLWAAGYSDPIDSEKMTLRVHPMG